MRKLSLLCSVLLLVQLVSATPVMLPILIWELIWSIAEAFAELVGKHLTDFLIGLFLTWLTLDQFPIDNYERMMILIRTQPTFADLSKLELGFEPELNPALVGYLGFIRNLLFPSYALVIVVLLMIYMFSGSTEQRRRVKRSLMLLFLSVPFVIFSPLIAQLFMWLNEQFFKWSEPLLKAEIQAAMEAIGTCKGGISLHLKLGFFRAFFPYLMLYFFAFFLFLSPIIVLYLKLFMLVLWGILLPLGFFLWAFYPTKYVGKEIVRQFIIWSLVGPMMLVLLAAIGIAYMSLPHVEGGWGPFQQQYAVEAGFGFAAMLALTVVPLLAVGIMNWIEMMCIYFAALEAPLMEIIVTKLEELKPHRG